MAPARPPCPPPYPGTPPPEPDPRPWWAIDLADRMTRLESQQRWLFAAMVVAAPALSAIGARLG